MVVIKKHFFDVKLEILNTEVQLAASAPEELHGRTINLDMTKFLKGKGCKAKFIIKKNEALEAKIHYFEVYPAYIRRLISHNISIVEDSFVCKAKDCELRLKPFLITRKRVHRVVRKALRDAAKDFLEKNTAGKTRDKIFHSALEGIMQRMMSIKLKKIYPLAVCEIRIIEVIKPKELLK